MIDKPFYFGGQTPTEILVHEAGHNAANAFDHDINDNYQYFQTGLQSNRHNRIYPTMENTLAIINDERNRKHMKVL